MYLSTTCAEDIWQAASTESHTQAASAMAHTCNSKPLTVITPWLRYHDCRGVPKVHCRCISAQHVHKIYGKLPAPNHIHMQLCVMRECKKVGSTSHTETRTAQAHVHATEYVVRNLYTICSVMPGVAAGHIHTATATSSA